MSYFETWQQWAARTCPPEHIKLIADRIDAMAAKTSADRQRAYREQQKKLGRSQRLKYLTDKENKLVDQYISELRTTTFSA